jgi:hypothetical protein
MTQWSSSHHFRPDSLDAPLQCPASIYDRPGLGLCESVVAEVTGRPTAQGRGIFHGFFSKLSSEWQVTFNLWTRSHGIGTDATISHPIKEGRTWF